MEKVVCNTKEFYYFTYGKLYHVIKDEGSYYIMNNDKGERSSPAKKGGFNDEPYFISLREHNLKKILQ